MTIKFYLAEKPRWAEIWDTIRVWIEKGYNSRFKDTGILPRSFAAVSDGYSVGGDLLTIEKAKDELTIRYAVKSEGHTWLVLLFFKRGRKSVYCKIEVGCDNPMKTPVRPKIANMLISKFRGLNESVTDEVPRIDLAELKRQLDRIEAGVKDTRNSINRLWDWFRESFLKSFFKVFGIRREATPELALEMLVRKNSYLRCFEKTKMKDPHKSQVIAVVEYVRNGHPIDHNARQNEIQSKTAYTINQAAEDVLRIAAEPCHKLPGAWTKAKDLADGCRQFMGKEDDPFVYKN